MRELPQQSYHLRPGGGHTFVKQAEEREREIAGKIEEVEKRNMRGRRREKEKKRRKRRWGDERGRKEKEGQYMYMGGKGETETIRTGSMAEERNKN